MIIDSEKAFDLLPLIIDIYEKLDIKGFAEKEKSKLKLNGKDKEEIAQAQKKLGESVIKYIARNSKQVKEEFFGAISIIDNITVEEAKQRNPIDTINTFIKIFNDKDFVDFFKSAMQ